MELAAFLFPGEMGYLGTCIIQYAGFICGPMHAWAWAQDGGGWTCTPVRGRPYVRRIEHGSTTMCISRHSCARTTEWWGLQDEALCYTNSPAQSGTGKPDRSAQQLQYIRSRTLQTPACLQRGCLSPSGRLRTVTELLEFPSPHIPSSRALEIRGTICLLVLCICRLGSTT